jgi:hypothetical protein
MRPQSLRHSRDESQIVCQRCEKKIEKTFDPDCREKNTPEHQTISKEDQMHMCIIVDTEIATEKQASFSQPFHFN